MWTNLKRQILLIAFVVVSAVPIVICSEKSYWYCSGFGVFAVAAYYSAAVFFGLWAIQVYRVDRFAPLFLCATLFGVLVEGLMTPIVYEGGPLDPIMVIWTSIAWHGLLSFILFWRFFRKCLLRGETRKVAIASALFGAFLGFWSLIYYLPDIVFIGDEHARLLGEDLTHRFKAAVERGGDVQALLGEVSPDKRAVMESALACHEWPIWKYALWTLVMTAWLAGAHYLLGYLWPTEFLPSKALVITAGAALILFSLNWLPAVPWAPIKLAVVLTIVLLPLRKYKRTAAGPTVFEQLQGKIDPRNLRPFLLLPVAATFVYALHGLGLFSETFIRNWISEVMKLILIAAGTAVFLWSIARTIRPRS